MKFDESRSCQFESSGNGFEGSNHSSVQLYFCVKTWEEIRLSGVPTVVFQRRCNSSRTRHLFKVNMQPHPTRPRFRSGCCLVSSVLLADYRCVEWMVVCVALEWKQTLLTTSVYFCRARTLSPMRIVSCINRGRIDSWNNGSKKLSISCSASRFFYTTATRRTTFVSHSRSTFLHAYVHYVCQPRWDRNPIQSWVSNISTLLI